MFHTFDDPELLHDLEQINAEEQKLSQRRQELQHRVNLARREIDALDKAIAKLVARREQLGERMREA